MDFLLESPSSLHYSIPMEPLIRIRTQEDWDAHRESLNTRFSFVENKEKPYEYEHVGAPQRFPCLVESEFEFNDQGRDQYLHKFLYKEDIEQMLEQFNDFA